MRIRVVLIVVAVCFTLGVAARQARSSHAPAGELNQSRPIGITHATVIDVENNRQLRDYTVVIEGTRIATVGPSSQVRVPDGYGIIDARGKFVIPGLIDTHVHLMWDRDSVTSPDSTIRWLELFVPFGVTTIREASARDLDIANSRWRGRRDLSGSPIPRMYIRVGRIAAMLRTRRSPECAS